MEKIHAEWEKRNSGVDAWEVELSKGENIEELEKELARLSADYIVAKTPVGEPLLYEFLESIGFHFVEAVAVCSHRPVLPPLPRIQERLVFSTCARPLNTNDRCEMESNVRAGMFVTDRVAVDPVFGPEKAAARYIGWIDDELNRGAELYGIFKESDVIGFFLLRLRDDNVAVAPIGGIYPKYQGFGYGIVMNCQEIMRAREIEAKKLLTTISLNNIGAFGVHLALNYSVVDQKYVFVKHSMR